MVVMSCPWRRTNMLVLRWCCSGCMPSVRFLPLLQQVWEGRAGSQHRRSNVLRRVVRARQKNLSLLKHCHRHHSWHLSRARVRRQRSSPCPSRLKKARQSANRASHLRHRLTTHRARHRRDRHRFIKLVALQSLNPKRRPRVMSHLGKVCQTKPCTRTGRFPTQQCRRLSPSLSLLHRQKLQKWGKPPHSRTPQTRR